MPGSGVDSGRIPSPGGSDSFSEDTTTTTLFDGIPDFDSTSQLADEPRVFDHIVQFYDTQDYLLNVLTNFIVPVLSSRDAAVIISTKDRMDILESRLQDRGVPVNTAKGRGQLIMIDAHRMLEKIRDGAGGTLFSLEPIASLLHDLSHKFAKTYVYGEIVDILCAQGNHSAAVQLEEMWNGLMNHYRFTLLCGYDTNNFNGPDLESPFGDVCCTHSRMEYSSLRDPNKQDIMIAMLTQKTRALETEIKRRKSVEDTLQSYLELLSAHAEESLRHQQESCRTLLSILPVGVYSATLTHDCDGIFVNKRFCELSGMDEEHLRTEGWFNAVHIDDRDAVRHLWDSSHRNFGGKQEYRYVLPDGTVRWVTGETVSFASLRGKPRTYVHTIVDISELKEVEKQRETASQKAEELLRHRVEQVERHRREQDQFIDTLCHELRNPLSSILGNIELLRIGLGQRESILASDNLDLDDLERLREQSRYDHESISAIEKCLAHQKVITDDVLNLSKLEVGKVALRMVEFNPKTTIIDAAKMFEAEANQKGVTLRFNLPMSDVIVKADPDRVSQVLINLLANALKFTPRGSITLEMNIMERKGPRILVKVSVKDDGIGLTKQEKDKLFHRFMQPTSTSYDEPCGSGLGLVISKSLVELMGGTISVESSKGLGSDFTFTFVAEELPHQGPTRSIAPLIIPKQYHARRIRQILVVEDNLINQRFLVRLLEVARFTCSTARNGMEALACMERVNFDLLLMDVHMPVMDGIACAREIRAREAMNGLAPVPIIGLSGNARDEHRHEALRSGMSYYLTKPCKKEELYGVIDKFDSQVG